MTIKNFEYIKDPLILYPAPKTFIEISLKEYSLKDEDPPYEKQKIVKYLAITRGIIKKKDGETIYKKGHTITIPEDSFSKFLSIVEKLIR